MPKATADTERRGLKKLKREKEENPVYYIPRRDVLKHENMKLKKEIEVQKAKIRSQDEEIRELHQLCFRIQKDLKDTGFEAPQQSPQIATPQSSSESDDSEESGDSHDPDQ
uniref:BZIP domain-containing protein n=1 Tax=Steinernema glaseri TaxID=37863 RepID=A0A1I7ZT34_9BILA